MSLSFEIVRRAQVDGLKDLAPLAPRRRSAQPQPAPWMTLSRPAAEPEPLAEAPAPAGEGPAPAPAAPAAPAEPSAQEIEAMLLQAREEGLRQGRAAGLQEALLQSREERSAAESKLVEKLSGAVVELEQLSERLVTEAENALVELSLAVAEHLVRHQLTTDPALLLKTIRQVLESSPQMASVKLSLHPVDRAVVEADLRRMHQQGGAKDRRVELQADPSLDRGDIVVMTEFGRIDGRIRSQIDRIRDRFRDTSENALTPDPLNLDGLWVAASAMPSLDALAAGDAPDAPGDEA